MRVSEVEREETRVRWLAPDLQCFPLKEEVLVDGERRLLIEPTIIEVLPDDTAVEMPRGVRVISPGKFCAVYETEYGQPFESREFCNRWEQRYGDDAPLTASSPSAQ